MRTFDMNNAFLLLGGNLGNKEDNLQIAREKIDRRCGHIIAQSSIYQTEAWGRNDQPFFLNQALHIRTLLTAPELMNALLEIETQMGRQRQEKYGPRSIDIDILLFNNEVVRNGFVTIPHPELQNRRFALTPLAEIAAEVEHPVLKKSISRLLQESRDPLKVEKYFAHPG